ncbi:MAG: hypothetical protein IJ545_07040 [Alphaproteobacteria bacterium]|nr:hypothetical protein [Alphaproteobacteria bacterium]
MANEITTVEKNQAVSTDILSDLQAFDNAQRIGKLLSQSQIIPAAYQNNLPNVMVALEISARTKTSPIIVMQNLNVIKGRPSWSSKYLIAALTSSRVYNLRYEMQSRGELQIKQFNATKKIENLACRVLAVDRRTGEERVGPWVTMEMAVNEGWYGKTDSKWQTMPEIMIRYRAATFFANVYYPELTVGLAVEDEIEPVNTPSAPREVVKSSELVAPVEENSKPKRARKTKEPTPVEPEVQEADFEEVAAVPTEVETTAEPVAETPAKPVPVVAPQTDDSEEWESWDD